jgi:GH15 family glucan-1,4-alpha-glucosidase
MCWVALDRLIELHDSSHLNAVPRERLEAERAAIRAAVEQRGFNEGLGSYTTVFEGDDVDASLLLLGRYGYVAPRSDRMLGTCRAIDERLARNGLLYRYRADDGLPGEEGAFGICSFWAVDCLCRQGVIDEASRRFEHLCSFANDLGLFAEEIDPETGEHLGNFPQAFTHVGLIDAALTLAERTGDAIGAPIRTPPHEMEAEAS